MFKRMDAEDRNAALERFRSLSSCVDLGEERELANWDEIAEMAGSGVEFESHGLTHALMTGIPSETARVLMTSASLNAKAKPEENTRFFEFPA